MISLNAERHYGMDWLRIGAFQLLILYHVGMAFVPWPYEVKVVAPIDWTTIPMLLTNPWRLSLLFAVSGYASAALATRSSGPSAFLRQRMVRLGVPLLFGIAVIVTPQPWVALVTQHGYTHGFGWFLLHDYYRFQFIDDIAMPTWMHLWFVVYLIAYTQIYRLLMALPAAWRTSARHRAERILAGPALLPLPIVCLYVVRSYGTGWTDTHMFINDWSAHATYLAMFLFGVLLRRSEPLRLAIIRWWRPAGIAAILGWLVLAAFELAYPGMTPVPHALVPLYGLFRATEGWAAIVALIGLADTRWNYDSKWRPMLAEAVFPFYIVHQTLILLIGYWLLGTATGGLARFVMLVAGTAAGCWLFYLIGRTIPPLRPLIGLSPRRRTMPAD